VIKQGNNLTKKVSTVEFKFDIKNLCKCGEYEEAFAQVFNSEKYEVANIDY
jgi:hypothetical protein